MSGFLVDTNVISEIVKPRPYPGVVQWLANTDESLIYFSVMTLGEIRKGISARPDLRRKSEIQSWLTALIDRFSTRILPVDLAIADRWGHLSGIAKSRGLTLSVVDALLAATALHYDLTLVTRNTSDVRETGVETLNPWNS